MKISLNKSSRLIIFAGLLSFSQLYAQVGGNNPTGVAGEFNGNVTTAGSYDPFTGSAHRSVVDMVIAGAVSKYGLSFSRTWTSRGIETSVGQSGGWNHSFAWSIPTFFDSPSPNPFYYPVSFPDGRVEVFTPQGGDWRAAAGTRERFAAVNAQLLCYLKLPDGGKVEFKMDRESYYDGELHQWFYNLYFTAQAIIDPYGQRTTLTYDTGGNLTQITEPAGRWIKLFYTTISGFPVIDYIQASDGRVVDYGYSTFSYPGGG
jgi:YD repeat-containing protein